MLRAVSNGGAVSRERRAASAINSVHSSVTSYGKPLAYNALSETCEGKYLSIRVMLILDTLTPRLRLSDSVAANPV